MPGMPASPRNSAYSDQPNAASTPTEISVSIVAVARRRFAHAARWKGSAPHTTTGAASVSDSHCQSSNCSGGTIASTSTGSVSSAEIRSRCSSGSGSSPPAAGSVVGEGRGVPGRLDGGDQLLGRHGAVVELDGRLLGGVVDGRPHAVELVEAALDGVRAAGARHALDRKLEPAHRSNVAHTP